MHLEAALRVLAPRAQGLVTTRDLVVEGVPGSTLLRAVRRGRLVRVGRGVLASAPLPELPRHLVDEHGPAPAFVLRARAALLARPGAAAGGLTAACLHGWPLLVEPARPALVVPHGSRRRAADGGARQVRGLRVEDVEVLPGTEPLRLVRRLDLVLDAASRLPGLEAVVLVDSALRAGAVDLSELRVAAARRPGRAAAGRVRQVLDLCDPCSGSVLETVLRVRLREAGVEGVTQQVLRDGRGRHVLRADFCFPAERLVVEVDGRRWHLDATRDQRTDNALVVQGWRVLRYDWPAVVHEGPRVVAEVVAALGRSGLHRAA